MFSKIFDNLREGGFLKFYFLRVPLHYSGSPLSTFVPVHKWLCLGMKHKVSVFTGHGLINNIKGEMTVHLLHLLGELVNSGSSLSHETAGQRVRV